MARATLLLLALTLAGALAEEHATAVVTSEPLPEEFPLDCPVQDTAEGVMLAGGYTVTDDATELQDAANLAYDTIVASNASDIPVDVTKCDLANATVTPIAGCTQVVAGTNWIVHFDISFASCKAKFAVRVNLFTPLPSAADPAPVLNDFEVNRKLAPAPKTVTAYAQCGGAGGACQEMAAEMEMSVADMCGNKDWPKISCEPGFVCQPWSRYYRQCLPSPVDLKCPTETGEPGSFVANTNTTVQLDADMLVWADLAASNATGLPADSQCDVANPTIEPISACEQVVAGTNWILTFKVSFPESCALYTYVDANVFEPLDGPPEIKGTRVAPYDAATEYQSCTEATAEVEKTCSKVLVFKPWEQCGGIDSGCLPVAEALGQDPAGGFCGDAAWASTECAYDTTCTRVSEYYYQCQFEGAV